MRTIIRLALRQAWEEWLRRPWAVAADILITSAIVAAVVWMWS